MLNGTPRAAACLDIVDTRFPPALGGMPRLWFAAQVRAGHEHLCAKHLAVRGYEVFLPSYGESRRWSDRVKVIQRALFVGYVFCRVSDAVVGKLITTPGVMRIVGDGSRPLPIESAEIEALQRAVAVGLALRPCEFLRSGHHVHIIQGPLRGSEGIVVRLQNRHRLILSVAMLRRSVSVEMDASWVRLDSAAWLDDVKSREADMSEVTTDGRTS